MAKRGILNIGLPLLILLTSSSSWSASPKEDKMRNNRIMQCIPLLQSLDKALRNGWRGHCNDQTLDEELAGGTDKAQLAQTVSQFSESANVVVESAPCDAVLPYTPVATTAACGKAAKSLWQSWSGKVPVQIRLPGNKCALYIPVLLTNKTDFACNAVQSRIACIDARYDAQRDRTTITLSTQRAGTPDFTSFEITADDIGRTQGNLDKLIQHPQFALVPIKIQRTDVIPSVRDAYQSYKSNCLARNSASTCERRSVARADAKMQELIRRHRNPGNGIAVEEKNKGAQALVAYLKEAGVDQKLENWILFLSLSANEVGLDIGDRDISVYDPIYTLSDAVAGDSGLSFGAHQIDIGANGDTDLALFWNIIRRYKTQHPTPVLDTAEKMKSCIALPLRLMTVRALDATYKTAPSISTALASDDGMQEYNSRLVNYLDEAARETSALPGVYKKSMMFRIIYADLKNQRGHADAIESILDDLEEGGADLNTCSGLAAAEDAALDKLIWTDPNNKRPGSETTYAIRYKNIKAIVRKRAPAGGLAGCI